MKISFLNQYPLYHTCLLVSVIRYLCGEPVAICEPDKADLILVGPFEKQLAFRRLGKEWRKLKKLTRKRSSGALRLFHTGENSRHDSVAADYSVTFDLDVTSERHFRLPLWMDSIDWSHEGVINTHNLRVRSLIKLEMLMSPLGAALLERPRRAALFAFHLKEPRRTLFEALSNVLPTEGFGRPFDARIKKHNSSGLYKDDVLKTFVVNLCPENSLYPGYYTEKVVEAYGAGCLPVTWADPNVRVDFNPGAIVNALEFAQIGYEAGLREALTPKMIARRAEVPLFSSAPTLEPFFEFMKRVISDTR